MTPDPQPHPWNTDFSWSPSAARSGRLSAEQCAAYDRDGFFVFEDAVGAEQLSELTAVLDGYVVEAEAFLASLDDQRLAIGEKGAIVFAVHAVTRFAEARALACAEVFTDLCHDLIGPSARLYWDQLVYKSPEKPRRFPFHQDNGYTFVEPQQYLTCWLALNDATIDNGCPWVVPGLHRNGTLAHTYIDPLGFECFESHPDAVAVPVKAGSVAVFSSLTPHLTGPNTTDAVRKAYILQYAPDGAEVLLGDAAAGGPETRVVAADPDRQFSVLRGGFATAVGGSS